MRKESRFIDDHPVLASSVRMAGIGAGVAGAIGLIKELRDALRDRKAEEERHGSKIDKNTIVVTIPKKASARDSFDTFSDAGKSVDVSKKEGDKRDSKGRFVPGWIDRVECGSGESCKKAQAVTNSWGDMTWEKTKKILLGSAAAAGGFTLVRKLHKQMEKSRLKREIEEAQQEYIGLLSRQGVKNAESISTALGCSMDFEKDAQTRNQISKDGIMEGSTNVSASVLAAYIAAVLGTGYITKKVLDNRFLPAEEEYTPPKVNKILFKTSSDHSFEIEPDLALACIGILKDDISDGVSIKSAAADDGYDYSFLDGVMADNKGKQFLVDYYKNSEGLGKAPDLMNIPGLDIGKLKGSHLRTAMAIYKDPKSHTPAIRSYVASGIKNDPENWMSVLGDKQNSDFISHMAGKTFNDTFAKNFSWLHDTLLGKGISNLFRMFMNTSLGKRLAAKNLSKTYGIDPSVLSKFNFSSDGWTKKAFDLDLASLVSKERERMANRKIINDRTNDELYEKMEEILASVNSKGKKKPKRDEKNHDIELSATDPEAALYVMKNINKIRSALNK